MKRILISTALALILVGGSCEDGEPPPPVDPMEDVEALEAAFTSAVRDVIARMGLQDREIAFLEPDVGTVDEDPPEMVEAIRRLGVSMRTTDDNGFKWLGLDEPLPSGLDGSRDDGDTAVLEVGLFMPHMLGDRQVGYDAPALQVYQREWTYHARSDNWYWARINDQEHSYAFLIRGGSGGVDLEEVPAKIIKVSH